MTARVVAGRSFAAAVSLGLLALVVAGGVAAGTTVPPCPAQTLTTPFAPWGDSDLYFLAPDGSMESTLSWTLSDGAKRVTGNEPWYVNSASDRNSLSLGGGGSAQTASVCVTTHTPALRMFVRNTGLSSAALRVELLYTDKYGYQRTATVTYLTAGSSWMPGPAVMFLRYIAPLVRNDGQTSVSFRFKADGRGGNWQIDDLFVDPLKGR